MAVNIQPYIKGLTSAGNAGEVCVQLYRSMADESTLGLAGILIIVSLFVTWYRRDPLVNPASTYYSRQALMDWVSSSMRSLL